MTNLVTFAQALADETRWRILQLAMNEALCVCELADILEMPQSSVSSHIQVIRKAGLLESEKCGKWVYYQVGVPHRSMVSQLAQVFKATPAQDAILKADAKRAAQRISKRDQSCCPLPQSLTRLKPVSQPIRHETE